jgi:hypothetical protein
MYAVRQSYIPHVLAAESFSARTRAMLGPRSRSRLCEALSLRTLSARRSLSGMTRAGLGGWDLGLAVKVVRAFLRQRLVPLLKLRREPVVARGPIGLEAGCRRKIDRGFLDVMPMLVVELSERRSRVSVEFKGISASGGYHATPGQQRNRRAQSERTWLTLIRPSEEALAMRDFIASLQIGSRKL